MRSLVNLRHPDVLAVLVLFLLAAPVGTVFIANWNGIPVFYQPHFGPAVMWACGRGFVNPHIAVPSLISVASGFVNSPPGLQISSFSDFLELKVDTFSCDELPDHIPTQALDLVVQSQSRYLLGVIALVWRLTGVSWSALAPLFGFFFGLVVILGYGIFRLGMGRPLAVIAGLLLMTSILHLINLPPLRDYAKAPFILALILISGCLVQWPLRRSTLFGLVATYGVVLGVGLGFRSDLLITIPPFVATLFVFLPGSLLANLKLKIAALFLFLACFLLAGAPVIFVHVASTGNWGNLMLGLMDPFNATLGVENRLYTWGQLYADALVFTQLQSYSYRLLGHRELLLAGSQAFEQASRQYFLEIIRNFPADLLIRLYAAIFKILELPFTSQVELPTAPFFLDLRPEVVGFIQPILLLFYHWRNNLINCLSGLGPWLTLATLLLVSAHNLRKAIFLTFFLVYFAGYPALQFQPRHYFYLEFISLWVVGFLVQQILRASRSLSQPETRRRFWTTWRQSQPWHRPSLQRILGFVLALLALMLGPLLALRTYQQQQLENIFTAYMQAGKEPLTPIAEPIAERDHWTLLRIPNFPQPALQVQLTPPGQPQSFPIITEYLVVALDPQKCNEDQIELTFRYRGQTQPYAPLFSATYLLDLPHSISDNLTHLFFPVYDFGNSVWSDHFQGIEIRQNQVACLTNLYRLTDLSRFPLLLTLFLPSNWQQAAHYQMLTETPLDNLLIKLWATPQFTLNQKFEGWTLAGYDVAEEPLINGEPMSLKLYWLPPPQIEPIPSDNFYHQIANRWVQLIQVQNLIPDGGFEKEAAMTHFPYDIYGAGPETRALVTDVRQGQATTVAVLKNSETFRNTSFASEPIPVNEDSYYLQAGWLRSESSSAFLGRQWLPGGNYDYVIGEANPAAWTHHAQVVKPPSGTNATQIWLLNFKSQGKVYFDNIVLVELGQPNRSACHTSDTEASLRCGPPLLPTASNQ